MTDDDKSLGDQHTFDGETPGKPDTPDASLGDEMTYAGGASTGPSSLGDEMTHDGQASAGPSSLGDEVTFSGVAEGLEDDLVDDGMEVVDLEERYTIEGELGKGGMGEVLLATDKRLDRKVAIKRVLGKAARSKKAWQRFENGAKTIAKLNHQNIVRVYKYGLAKDGPFMILEYVSGGSLLDRCKQGPIPLKESVDITCQLCDGIANAHKAGIVHRDIKPANVLMTEDGIPKLNDFDLAKEQAGDSGMTQEGAVLGTLAFMPPEQQKDATLVDQRSDLWSLAATLYQMVTGESPKVIRLKKVPPQLQDVLDKALEDEKDDRYQNAREFRDALRASLSAPVPAAVEAVTDLGVGQCPECHAKNKDTSKVCTKCSTALRVDCLNCGESIPVWHPGCGQCGTRQSELIQQRKDEVDAKRTEAETLADQYEFDKAIALAAEIVEIEDKRWSHQLGWADQFISETQEEKERQKEEASRLFEEAKRHHEAHDNESAIRALAGIEVSIMESLHVDKTELVEEERAGTQSLLQYLRQIVLDKKELDELMATIKERVKARDLDGLLEQVDRALELDPNREKLIPLQGQLQKRQAARAEKYDEIHKQARQQLNEGNAKAALRIVSRIKEDGFPPHLKALKQQLTKMVELENELTALVKGARADALIDQDEINAILPKADHYLIWNPDHAVIRKLRDDLQKRSLSRKTSSLPASAWNNKVVMKYKSRVFAEAGFKEKLIRLKLDATSECILTQHELSTWSYLEGRLLEMMFGGHVHDIGGGLVVIAAPTQEELSACWYKTLSAKDAITSDLIQWVDNNHASIEQFGGVRVKNILTRTYDSFDETPTQNLSKILLCQPDVLFVPVIADGDLLKCLCTKVLEINSLPERRLTIVTQIAAKSAAEALTQLYQMADQNPRFIQAITGALFFTPKGAIKAISSFVVSPTKSAKPSNKLPDLTDLPASVRHKKAAKMLAVSVDRLTEMRNNRDIEGFRDAGKWKYKIEELKRVAADLGLTLDTSGLSQGESENGIDFDGPISKGQDQTQGRMGGLFGGGL